MAILWMDGFDTYTSGTQSGIHYPGSANLVGPTAVGRFGTNGYVLSGSGTTLIRNVGSNVAEGGMCFSRKVTPFSSDAVICEFVDVSTVQVGIYRTSLDKIQARRGATVLGTSTLSLNSAVNHIEIKVKIHGSTGTVEVRVNGDVYLVLTGLNTSASGNAYFTKVVHTGSPPSATDALDDLVIWDTTGGVNNDFLGDVRVSASFPTGAGNYTQWTPSTGSNWQNVDDASPNDDTDYNSDSTPGHIDTFAMTDLPAAAVAVKAVKYVVYARKDDAGVRQIAPLARIAGADYVGTTVSLGTSYGVLEEIHDTSPATAVAWTVSEVNALEFGYKEIA